MALQEHFQGASSLVPKDVWRTLGPFRVGDDGWHLCLRDAEVDHQLVVIRRLEHYLVHLDGRELEVQVLVPAADDGWLRLSVGGEAVAALVDVVAGEAGHVEVWVHTAGVTRQLIYVRPARHADAAHIAGVTAFASPMPGSVISLPAQKGQRVQAGSVLVVVEAMKMEHPVVAPADGTVVDVHVSVGASVEAGAPLLSFEPDEGAERAAS